MILLSKLWSKFLHFHQIFLHPIYFCFPLFWLLLFLCLHLSSSASLCICLSLNNLCLMDINFLYLLSIYIYIFNLCHTITFHNKSRMICSISDSSLKLLFRMISAFFLSPTLRSKSLAIIFSCFLLILNYTFPLSVIESWSIIFIPKTANQRNMYSFILLSNRKNFTSDLMFVKLLLWLLNAVVTSLRTHGYFGHREI